MVSYLFREWGAQKRRQIEKWKIVRERIGKNYTYIRETLEMFVKHWKHWMFHDVRETS